MSMYIIGKVAAAAVLCAGTSAQEFVLTGGVPPAPANPKDCDIAGLFNHIETVTTSEVCRAGCNGGACTGPPDAPDEWYPDHEDECNEECGAQIHSSFKLFRRISLVHPLSQALSMRHSGTNAERCLMTWGESTPT